eukprot:6177941-Pleurochrysis_carterae.AAC.1
MSGLYDCGALKLVLIAQREWWQCTSLSLSLCASAPPRFGCGRAWIARAHGRCRCSSGRCRTIASAHISSRPSTCNQETELKEKGSPHWSDFVEADETSLMNLRPDPTALLPPTSRGSPSRRAARVAWAAAQRSKPSVTVCAAQPFRSR